MIIAVDYDGTLYANGSINERLVSRLIAEQRRGNCCILWTCREGKRLDQAIRELRRYGFSPNYVNCNCPQAIRMLGHDSRKVYADVYIDDKARC